MRLRKFFLSAGLIFLATNSQASPSGEGWKKPDAIRENFYGTLKGKKIAYVPVAMGMPLTIAWYDAIRKEAESLGMKFELRDPNWNSAAQAQAVSSLIAQKIDVLVVQNNNVQSLAKLLEQAEKAGIYVIQVNMGSNYQTDAFVGVDWVALGQAMAEDIVKACDSSTGKSGKVAIVQGELTAEASVAQLKGAMSVFEKAKGISIVSNQAADWDAGKAHTVTSTVLQQHKDLCATYGFWDAMQIGAAQAIKEANLTGKVLVYASGDGNRLACDGLASGAFDKYWNYDAPAQGRDIMVMAKTLLLSGLKPGTLRLTSYTPWTVVDKAGSKGARCWETPRI